MTKCHQCVRYLPIIKAHIQYFCTCKGTGCLALYCDQMRNAVSSRKPVSEKPPLAPAAMKLESGPQSVQNTPKNTQVMKYGLYLQHWLHARSCISRNCPRGKECTDTKAIVVELTRDPNSLSQVARHYKYVINHYQGCKIKEECPVCKMAIQSAGSVVRGTITDPSSSKGSRLSNGNGTTSAQHTVPPADLIQVHVSDLRRESDAVTHTPVDLSEEKVRMLAGVPPSLDPQYVSTPNALESKKESFTKTNLFNAVQMKQRIERIGSKYGVMVRPDATQCLTLALQNYLKHVLEELVINSQLRNNVHLPLSLPKGTTTTLRMVREPTALVKMQLQLQEEMMHVKTRDVALRKTLLSQANEEDLLSKERARKRRKNDKGRSTINENEEIVETSTCALELAEKDLKKRLFAEHSRGTTRSLGSVNLSLVPNQESASKHRITMADAIHYLRSNSNSVRPEIYCRAEAAMLLHTPAEK